MGDPSMSPASSNEAAAAPDFRIAGDFLCSVFNGQERGIVALFRKPDKVSHFAHLNRNGWYHDAAMRAMQLREHGNVYFATIAKRLATMRTGDEEPAPDATRHALRDVIGHCLYGVDQNPMAVELCKVSLWMEALEPGKPLNFLEHRIRLGNSLLGATPFLLDNGIPDAAFNPIEGDNPAVCRYYKKENRQCRSTLRNLDACEITPPTVECKIFARVVHCSSSPRYLSFPPSAERCRTGLRVNGYRRWC
jgi:hypothetical protein